MRCEEETARELAIGYWGWSAGVGGGLRIPRLVKPIGMVVEGWAAYANYGRFIPTISETQAMMAPNGGRLARRGGAEYSTYSATSQRGQRFARQVRAPVGSLNVGITSSEFANVRLRDDARRVWSAGGHVAIQLLTP